MAEHEPCIGATDEWFTPRELLNALGELYDLDPCSPGPGHWVPAVRVYTKADDGLAQPWIGFVFMNPPFGGRNGHVPWLEKFLAHGYGIAIVRASAAAQGTRPTYAYEVSDSLRKLAAPRESAVYEAQVEDDEPY